MRSRVAPFIGLLIVGLLISWPPTSASAQGIGRFPGRGGMGGGRGGRGQFPRPGDGAARTTAETPPAPLTRIELQQFDPIALLIDRRGYLSLDDSVVARVSEIEDRLRARVEPTMARVDSLAHTVIALGDTSGAAERSDDDRESLIRSRIALTRAVNEVRAAQDSSAAEALGLLTSEQRAKAEPLLSDQRARLDDLTRPRRSRDAGDSQARRRRPPGRA